MTRPFLTIGMATYDDYHGVYFTIQHLRLMFEDLMPIVQFVVIDNNPLGEHGKAVAEFIRSYVPNGKYVAFSGYQSPTVKGLVFNEADAEHVLCMDCHVLLPKDSLNKLCQWFKDNQFANILAQGPLWYDALDDNISTHFDQVWRGEMFGTWASDPRGVKLDQEPFEIRMQGMGLFAMNKKHWPGFNRLFRGFGAEEGYIHEKVRQRGGKCICLPFMRWIHRFKRPGGAPYVLTVEDRVRNYLLGYIELGLPIDAILEHFKDRMSPAKIMQQAKTALNESIKHGVVEPNTRIRMVKPYEPASGPKVHQRVIRPSSGKLLDAYL